MNNNPFNPPGKSYGSTSVADRLDAVARFNRAQFEQALKVPGLQQYVYYDPTFNTALSLVRQFKKLEGLEVVKVGIKTAEELAV